MTLPGEQLTERVGDVDDLDIGWVDHRLGEGQVDHLAGEIREVATLPGEVAREVA